MFSKALANQSSHDLELTRTISRQLFDLCVAAAIEMNPKTESADSQATQTTIPLESKTEMNALAKAHVFIDELDSMIASFKKGGLQQSKAAIYTCDVSGSLYSRESINSVHNVIANRLDTLLPLLLKEISDEKLLEAYLSFAVKNLNYKAFSLLRDGLLRHKIGAQQLAPQILAALEQSTASSAENIIQDQEKILGELAREREMQKHLSNIETKSNNALRLAATRAFSPKLVSLFAPMTSAAVIENTDLLTDLLNVINPEEMKGEQRNAIPAQQAKIQQIFDTLLTQFKFNQDKLNAALLLVIRLNGTIDVQEIMNLLKSKGATVSEAILNTSLRERLSDSGGSNKSQPQIAKEIRILHAMGAKLNRDREDGLNSLRSISANGDACILQTVLELEYFSDSQLNDRLGYMLNANIFNLSQAALFVKYGASLYQPTGTTERSHYFTLLQKAKQLDADSRPTVEEGGFRGTFSFNLSSYQPARTIPAKITQAVFKTKTKQITDLCINGIENLNQEERAQLLFSLVMNVTRYDSIINNAEDSAFYLTFVALFNSLRNPLALRAQDNRTILFWLIKLGASTAVKFVCDKIKAEKVPLTSQGSFYYKIPGDHEKLELSVYIQSLAEVVDSYNSFDALKDKLKQTETTDLYILANANTVIIKALKEAGFSISDSALSVYKKIGDSQKATNYQEFFSAHATLSTWKNPGKSQPSTQPISSTTPVNDDEGEIKEGKELGAIQQRQASPDLIYSISELKKLSNTQIITMKPKQIAAALNLILETDTSDFDENQDSDFKDTIDFLRRIDEFRFDYMRILTDETHFPLRNIIQFGLRLLKVRPEIETALIAAVRVLLANAPYSQMKKLTADEKEFLTLIKSLPKKLAEFLQGEIKKPHATVGDLAYYLVNRAKEPDDKFYKRVETFNQLIEFLTKPADEKASAIDRMKAHQSKIAELKSQTEIAMFAGKTTKIFEGLEHERNQAPADRGPAYIDRVRFSSFNVKHRYIEEAKHALDKSYEKKPK